MEEERKKNKEIIINKVDLINMVKHELSPYLKTIETMLGTNDKIGLLVSHIIDATGEYPRATKEEQVNKVTEKELELNELKILDSALIQLKVSLEITFKSLNLVNNYAHYISEDKEN